MVFDSLYLQNSFLETSMQASMVRKDVILNNIANVDTPGYKKKEVVFEESLSRALDRSRSMGHLDLSSSVPNIKEVNRNFRYRLDDANVDMEVEMVNLYENSVRYDTMVSSVMNNYKRISTVLQVGR